MSCRFSHTFTRQEIEKKSWDLEEEGHWAPSPEAHGVDM